MRGYRGWMPAYRLGEYQLRNHLHWHKALMLVDSGNAEAALELYDESLVAPLRDDFYLDVCNTSSLLHRLEMRGLDMTVVGIR